MVHSDLKVPLNDAAGMPSPMAPRVRKGTIASEDQDERAAKMRIDMNSDGKKGSMQHERFSRTFLS